MGAPAGSSPVVGVTIVPLKDIQRLVELVEGAAQRTDAGTTAAQGNRASGRVL
jgi:hypothetical protein